MSLLHIYTSLDMQLRLMYSISANMHRTFATQHCPLLASGVTTFRVSGHRKSRFIVQLLSCIEAQTLSIHPVMYFIM